MVPHLDTIATVRSIEHELALKQVGQRPRNVAPQAAVLPLTCLLTLATGVALLVLAWIITPPDVPLMAAAAPSADGLATVQAFYEAANDTLRTGDSAALDRILAPDLVEHAVRPGLPPGRDGFIQYLARLRAAQPTLRFEVEAVLANGDLVSARVTARAPASNAPLDGLASDAGTWTGVDVFRVVDGLVAERWSGSDAPFLVQPLARVPLNRWSTESSVMAAARLTVAPGAEVSGVALLGPGLMVVEAGALVVQGSGEAQVFRGSSETAAAPPMVVPSGTEQVLGLGEVVAFPAGSSTLSLRNEGPEPVVALAVAWFPPLDEDTRAAGPAGEAGQRGTRMATLADGGLTAAMLPVADGGHALDNPGITVTPLGSLGSLGASQVLPGRVVVTLDRVMLVPGTSPPPRVAKGLVFLIVEAGTVGLIPVRETAWVRFPTGRQEAASAGSETTLAEGEAAFWDTGAVALLRGRHDTAGSALLLAISPAGQGGENAG